MIADLASLLAPHPEQAFVDHFLAKTRLHLRFADRSRAVGLLPWSAIERLVETERGGPDAFVLRRDGLVVREGMYARDGARDHVRPQALRVLLAQGSSIVIDHVHELVPEIGRLSGSIERRLGCKVWVNAYLTFGNSAALKPHYDTHDVLILQVHGRKRWRSFGSAVPMPVAPAARGTSYDKVVWEDWLEQGDALYLPRGEAHAAEAKDENSVHLTIGFLPRRGVDLLDWLGTKAAAQELFRSDLPQLGSDADVAAREAQLKQRLHTMIDELSVAELLQADDRERAPQSLVSLDFAMRPSATDLVVPTPRRRIPLATDRDDTAEVVIGGETHRLSAPARRVLARLLEHDAQPFANIVAEFASPAGENQARDAVQELIAHGLAVLRAASDPFV
jgi:Cupin superfamily protein